MRSATKSKTLKRPLRSSRAPKPEDYRVVIEWSAEDECYLARLPAWQDVRTHGKTVGEAAEQAREVLEMLLATARRKRQEVPPPQRNLSG
jgi:predicted RNase H-like HicB family nuclease